MDDFNLIVLLLPIIFMIHDFEEILFFKWWIRKYEGYLIKHYPRLSSKMLPHVKGLSTPAFSLAVCEEFVLISIAAFTAVYMEYYYIWLMLFMAFSIHLVVHIIQWIIIRKYIPCIITSILFLPYSIFSLKMMSQLSLFTYTEFILCAFIGIVFMIVNLIAIHKVAGIFDKWIQTKNTSL
ncbi:HXXEE domain-containing protein [Dysgonomonas macrotermitis]|uniref:HXXEE domain-containing protein n=1 Tax=Dysgonomonas macrotermitis TaxID=1346286 RepID=A0A1M5AZN1_9BACT|nr:HXXEE domain-containing protein [Dysgonomonas macrotermitis]SHF35761.1 Protein of unknown function with HXXEE motif-containing protein [Dysgonomonas macrotermitis]